MIREVCDCLNRLAMRGDRPPLCQAVVVGIDTDPAAKVTLLLFDESGELGAVAKVARQDTAEQSLLAEHAVLVRLWASPLPTTAGELPRPLLMTRLAGRTLLVTTALRGGPLAVRYYQPGHVQNPHLVAEDFRLAGTWIAKFQQETATGEVVLGIEAFDRWVAPVFERYRVTVGSSPWEEQLVGRLGELARELGGVRVPMVAVHGDYAVGNLLAEGRHISGVVDWELGRRVGLPFSDLFKFVASYGSYLDRAAPPRNGALPGHPGWADACRRWGGFTQWANALGVLYAYFGRGWFPDMVRAFLLEHFRRLDVPPAAAALFLPMFVAQQAMALENPIFRGGYRSLLSVLWRDGDASWLRLLETVG
jgi:Phosphotransferase enzyme family